MRISPRKEVAIWAIAIGLLVAGIALKQSRWGQRIFDGGPGPVAGPIPEPIAGTLAPPANRKVAFIGDTGAGADFRRVLELIRDEKTDAVVHMGDAIYAGETPVQFWTEVDTVLGHQYPYFLAQGNHDVGAWPAMAEHAAQHLRRADAITVEPSLQHPRFAAVTGGVSLLTLGEQVEEDDPRFVIDQLSRDPHIWKVCNWHKNQEQLQVGGKGNQMGFGVYEACRQMGALVMTAHEHSYHRTRTLASTLEQKVDATCPEPGQLCVRPGAVPVFVSGLGGRSIRDQERCLPTSFPYGCKREWAFVYTTSQAAHYGALFITFHVDGDPRKARGYFKNVEGVTVDRFELTAR
jgi:hypothetical protein